MSVPPEALASVDEQWWWKCACGSEGRKRWPNRRAAEVKAAAHDRKCGGYAVVTCKDPSADAEDDLLRRGHENCLWCDEPATNFCDGLVAVRYDYRRVRCDAPICDGCSKTTHTSLPGVQWDLCPLCVKQGEPGPHETVNGRPCHLPHDKALMREVFAARRGRMVLVYEEPTT